MPDRTPYVPRIDLWFNAKSATGTLPPQHQGRNLDEISRAQGWALHKVVPDYINVRKPSDSLHRAIGVFSLKETVYDYRFSSDVEIQVVHEGDRTKVEYHTPVGMVSTSFTYSSEMVKAGVSTVPTTEHIIKKQDDYKVVAYLFENLVLIPDSADFDNLQKDVGEDGLVVTLGGRAASPLHHIQKHFIGTTEFYYHYNDYQKEMRALSDSMENFFNQALNIIADSKAEAVLWGNNFDDMITPPPFFKIEILPWLQRIVEVLSARGKYVFCHCDGENQGLMDLILDSGIHVAEAVCPHPMTKVKIEDYYQRWAGKLTIFGGIPSIMLLEESVSSEEFESYLDHLFKAVAPGQRLILGIADTTPPNAVFDRLVRIGERVDKEGRLPLEGGAYRPLDKHMLIQAAKRIPSKIPVEDDEIFQTDEYAPFKIIQKDVLKGDRTKIIEHIQQLLDEKTSAKDILKRGMLPAMEIIGKKFTDGNVFIPEVLLAARAMNEATKFLKPYLTHDSNARHGRVLIGTVSGDYHDIGKNLVTALLEGTGFEIRDLGTNVPTKVFIKEVLDFRPDILALSALLTTTMPEMKKIINTLAEEELRDHVKVIVGGAPVNAKFARDIGADGYGTDAGEAVALSKKIVYETTKSTSF